jgi:hypothetical protein
VRDVVGAGDRLLPRHDRQGIVMDKTSEKTKNVWLNKYS